MKAIRRILTKNQKHIEKAKQKIKEEAKRGVMKLKEKVPSVDELKEKFQEQSCDPANVEKMEKNYTRLKKVLGNVKNKVESSIKSLESLRSKMEKAVASLESIASITDAASKLTKPLQSVVSIADALLKGVGMIPGQFSFPAGPLIMAKDGAKLAEGKIKEITTSIEVYSKAINRPIGQIEKVMGMLDKAIDAVTNLKDQINMVEGLMSAIFLQTLQNCNTTVDPLASGSSGTTPEGVLDNTNAPGYGINNNNGSCSIPVITDPQECEDAGGIWTPSTMGSGDGFSTGTPGLNANPFDQGDKWWHLYNNLLNDLYLYGTDEIIEHAYSGTIDHYTTQVLGYRRYKRKSMTSLSPKDEWDYSTDSPL